MSVPNNLNDLKNPAPKTYPVSIVDGQRYTVAFNRLWPEQNDIALHLNAWREGLSKKEGGLGRLRHLIEAHNLIWPARAATINEWMIARFRALSSGVSPISFAGGSGTAKSTDVAYYALLWWWALPSERTVIVASTTVAALTKRIWSYIAEGLYSAAGNMPGHISNSPPPKILFDKRDPKHGIHGAALKEGNADKTLADLIGIHPKDGLLFIVDEASDVTPAVNDVRTNLDSGGGVGTSSFQQVMIANSKSRLDPHGRASEPKLGWQSVNPDVDTQWATKDGGLCLFFDCYRSPAVVSPDKAKFPFLINAHKIAKDEQRLGKDHPRFWRFVRGFWPPEDLAKTVLTMSLIAKHRAKDHCRCDSRWQITLAGLDPAFTADGDEIILQFATMGVNADTGLVTLDFGGPRNTISLKLDTRSKEPVNYQILHMTKQECIARGVKPEHFGGDFWGFGLGAGDIIEKNWSPEIHRINGIGAPSEDVIDPRSRQRACDMYDRKATELWFNFRSFVESGQVRGMTDEVEEEMCSRLYTWKAKKMSLEGKQDYKERMGKGEGPTGSPDRSDAYTIVLDVALKNGLIYSGREIEESDKHDWQEQWEIATGKRSSGGVVEEFDREEMWSSDAILDSAMFEGSE